MGILWATTKLRRSIGLLRLRLNIFSSLTNSRISVTTNGLESVCLWAWRWSSGEYSVLYNVLHPGLRRRRFGKLGYRDLVLPHLIRAWVFITRTLGDLDCRHAK